jgi:hypothetical protein
MGSFTQTSTTTKRSQKKSPGVPSPVRIAGGLNPANQFKILPTLLAPKFPIGERPLLTASLGRLVLHGKPARSGSDELLLALCAVENRIPG